jgi:hypothetical protein
MGLFSDISSTVSEKAKQFKDSLLDSSVQVAINQIKDRVLNPKIAEYGEIKQLEYKDKKVRIILALKGMEETLLEASANKIIIAEDGSSIQFDDFDANKAFLKAALQNFGNRKIEIPEEQNLARSALQTVRKYIVGA